MSNVAAASNKANADPTVQTARGATNENPAGIGFWALVAEDLKTHDGDVFAQGFWALLNHRFGNWRMGVRPKILRAPLTLLYRFWRKLTQITCGIDLPYTVKVGRRVKLEHFGGMILVAESIGNDVVIRQNTTFGIRSVAELGRNPVIEDGADIGVGVVALGRVVIGARSVVGANSVVLSDIPPDSVAVGAPARVVKRRDAPSRVDEGSRDDSKA
jgi:serine O-acetyltransferase